MDFIVRLTDRIQDFNGYVEVVQLSTPFNHTEENLLQMLKVENRLVEGNYHMILRDFLACISNAVDRNEQIPTPLLPKSCLKHVWLDRASQKQYVYVEVPKQKWDITYHTQKFEQVGFPRMIFKYLVVNDKVQIETIVAVKDNGTIKEDTELFHFPFSHVSTEGNVCMGGNTFPTIKSIQQLSTMHTLFISAPFGDDYGTKTTTNKVLREMFQELANHDFNDEWLKTKNKEFNIL